MAMPFRNHICTLILLSHQKQGRINAFAAVEHLTTGKQPSLTIPRCDLTTKAKNKPNKNIQMYIVHDDTILLPLLWNLAHGWWLCYWLVGIRPWAKEPEQKAKQQDILLTAHHNACCYVLSTSEESQPFVKEKIWHENIDECEGTLLSGCCLPNIWSVAGLQLSNSWTWLSTAVSYERECR